MSNIALFSVAFDLLLMYITSSTSLMCFNTHSICIAFDPLLRYFTSSTSSTSSTWIRCIRDETGNCKENRDAIKWNILNLNRVLHWKIRPVQTYSLGGDPFPLNHLESGRMPFHWNAFLLKLQSGERPRDDDNSADAPDGSQRSQN